MPTATPATNPPHLSIPISWWIRSVRQLLTRWKKPRKGIPRITIPEQPRVPWVDVLSPPTPRPTPESPDNCTAPKESDHAESRGCTSEPPQQPHLTDTPRGEAGQSKSENCGSGLGAQEQYAAPHGRSNQENSRPVDASREAAARLLHLPDLSVVDVTLATLFANEIPGDPLWLGLVSPPSNGKTELLTAAASTPHTYLLSTLTKNTLISGYQVQPGESEPSLLAKLSGKTLILKDFTTILGLQRDERNVILGLLREVYDGRIDKSFGTGKTFTWLGKMGLLAGVTPIFDRHSVVQAILGERFLLYRIPSGDREERQAQALKALEGAGKEAVLRKKLGDAMKRSYTAATTWYKEHSGQISVPLEMTPMLAALANLAAYGRAGVIRDGRDREVRYVPEPEGPARLVKELRQLLIGLTIVHGKLQPDEEELSILRKVARDTMHPHKARVLAALTKTDMAFEFLRETIKLPKITARREVEDCELLGLIEKDPVGDWRLSKGCREDIEASGMFAN